MPGKEASSAALPRLLSVMAKLRDPATGCPWDLAQDFATIAPYTVEEGYEVADAIARGPDPAALRDELGDLLFQVVYHARLAEERGWFSFADVAEAIADKMIRRHPHVFGEAAARSIANQGEAWEAAKDAERQSRAESGVLAGVAPGLPALVRADKLVRRAARVGFDWPDPAAVLDKLDEETAELRAELRQDGQDTDITRIGDEVGDMLFVLVNLARKLGLGAEACLAGANQKFTRRFNAVEAALAAQGLAPADVGLPTMEAAWEAVKRGERTFTVPWK